MKTIKPIKIPVSLAMKIPKSKSVKVSGLKSKTFTSKSIILKLRKQK